nr:immunoglobulin heavy chain junction region [Macaca mulatta]MOW46412.1 immunoglobulin heavy chain junction region [Macaca mulatta]MOW47038.1 immunoglobulin heavy chain junction region [Macaca mulatta]MOW47465.1 immunoglobulin heavy chain junction region [Macaca mulatta]MOW47803.1 immunoglobulin heavy chain junction region [Macaca mulatta]
CTKGGWTDDPDYGLDSW